MEMNRMIAMFMEYCKSKQLRERTMLSYEQSLKLFAVWLEDVEEITHVEKIKEMNIRRYIIELQSRGKYARDEHRQAIEWLNQHTDENIGFFLVEIELWRINDSVPAPKFNVVERPNDWAKTVKAAGGLSETKKLQYEFWQAFCQYAFGKADFAQQFSRRKALPQHWYDLSIGSSACHVGLTVNTVKKTIGAEIYIDDDKALFEKYKSRKQEIEAELNTELIWRVAAKACRILAVNKGIDLQCREKWPEYFEWLCIMTCKLREITKQYG